MIKSFVWTLTFWTLFVLFNTVGDAIDFYAAFPWYGNMDLWHFLKYFWIGFAVLTGYYACYLYYKIWNFVYLKETHRTAKQARRKAAHRFTLLLLFFLLYRWGLHEFLMYIWRQ